MGHYCLKETLLPNLPENIMYACYPKNNLITFEYILQSLAVTPAQYVTLDEQS